MTNTPQQAGNGIDLGKVMDWLGKNRHRIQDNEYSEVVRQFIEVLTAHLNYLVDYMVENEHQAALKAVGETIRYVHGIIAELTIKSDLCDTGEYICTDALRDALDEFIEAAIPVDVNVEPPTIDNKVV